MEDNKPLLTAGDLIALTGLTYRQLDYWTQQRIIPVVHGGIKQGVFRHYDPEIVPRVALLVKVSRAFGGKTKLEFLKKLYERYLDEFYILDDGLVLSWRINDDDRQ